MFESSPAGVNLRPSTWLTILPALRWLGQQLAPPVCLLCGEAGQWDKPGEDLDLCADCEAACRPAAPESLPFDASFCLFEYRDPVDQLVTGLKFNRDLACARVLGTLFARRLARRGQPLPECLVPMPLHRLRYRERGFCQTTELARHICAQLRRAGLRLPVCGNLLERTRHTRAQSSLGAAERAANLQGAFGLGSAARDGHLPGHVALLDDVLTTGHTALAAAGVLKAGGVRKVEVWCCARAMFRPEGP